MEKLWSLLQKKIEATYGISDPEWVQVEVSRKGKIHVTIVSDKQFSKEDIRNLIQDELNHRVEGYRVGFINIYSVQLAAELNVVKTTKNQKVYSWADGLNADVQEDDKDTKLNIISFYSYKGGVGRTVALIETAYNLVKAGKRVLLLDLDIEAPSLHNLFADKVNDEVNGVQYGMVEYLYRTVIQGRTDVLLSDIYCPLQLNNVEGAMFLIPALKTMDKDYIYQIGRLQTEQVHDKDVFSKLFKEIEKDLPVDIILIDTRAGFNPWGSLSLFSLSTQIIFVAYPNTENVEGLNVAFRMLENMGKKRYAVAMSKIVASDDGLEKSLKLFEKLDLPQDRLIPIYYREEIALNNVYPITTDEISGAYCELSNYILDSERIAINRRYLANGQKYRMLRGLSFGDKKLIRLLAVERFIRQDSQTLLVYRFDAELYGLKNNVENGFVLNGNYLLPVTTYIFYNSKKQEIYKNILSNANLSPEQQGLELIWAAVSSCSEKEMLKFKPQCKWNSLEELLDDLKVIVPKEERLVWRDSGESNRPDEAEVTSTIKVIINLTEDFLVKGFTQMRDSILGIITAYKNIEFIQFKFVMEYNLWRKYQENLAALKAATLELNVLPEDIEDFFLENINLDLFSTYLRMMKMNYHYRENQRWYEKGDHTITDVQLLEVMELLMGIRKDIRTYSASVCDYVYNFLNTNKQICYNKLLDAIQLAVQMELEGADHASADDRLISFENLQYALESLK